MTEAGQTDGFLIKKICLYYAIIGWVAGISIYILLGNWDNIPVNNFNKIFILSIHLLSFAISPVVGIVMTAVMKQTEAISTSRRLRLVGYANGIGFITFAIVIILFVPFTIVSMRVEGEMNVDLVFVLSWFLLIFVATVISGTVTQYVRLRLQGATGEGI
jgi:hypothetical protein